MGIKKDDPLEEYSPFYIFFSHELQEELTQRAKTKHISVDTLYRQILEEIFNKDILDKWQKNFNERMKGRGTNDD